MEKLKINPVTGELDLVTILPTNEELQDSVFGILTDTPTVNLNYDDTNNQVTATVIDNSINNTLLAQMPANSIKLNPTNATANAENYVVPQDTVLGREANTNSGNVGGIPIQKIGSITTTLINGERTITDVNLSVTSRAVVTYMGTTPHTSVPIDFTPATGSMKFSTGQIGDNAEFFAIIYY